MAVYSRQVASALKKIKAKGQEIDFYVVESSKDEAAPWKTQRTPVLHKAHIVFFPVDSATYKELAKEPSFDVPEGFVLGYMGRVSFAVNRNSYVIRDGVKLKISNFDVIDPNGEVILYIILFQK